MNTVFTCSKKCSYNLAIYFKAFLALVSQFFHKIAIPFLDAVLGYAGLAVISYYWGKMTVYEGVGSYPMILFALVLPAYFFIWLISTYFAGGYDKPYNIGKAVLGVATGSVFVLVLYALLPESLRFSRALILFGTLWLALEMTMTRLIGVWMGKESFLSKRNAKKRFILIGSPDEAQRVEALIQSTSIKPDFIGLVSSDTNETPEGFIGRITQVPDIITIYKITEIIFSLDEDEMATGINEHQIKSDESPVYYNLSGQRINKSNAQKGVYIKNGKKYAK